MTPSDSDLLNALQGVVENYFGKPTSVAGLRRSPSANRSSFSLEELEVRLNDDGILRMIFKDMGPDALLPRARAAKPTFLYEPRRELEMYRTVLASAQLGTATCYGMVCDPARSAYWLFLEKVEGVELYKLGELTSWQQVARWLAGFHLRFQGEVDSLADATHLLRYDERYFRDWLQRALTFAEFGRRGGLKRLEGVHDRIVEKLGAMRSTLIHGEFYPSNILVQQATATLRVCPVDWEMAGVGPALIDLAALVSGNWTEEQKLSLAMAYHQALPADDGLAPVQEFLDALDYCRLHLDIQWLGWSPDWSPPLEHAHNWFQDAMELADKLGL